MDANKNKWFLFSHVKSVVLIFLFSMVVSAIAGAESSAIQSISSEHSFEEHTRSANQDHI